MGWDGMVGGDAILQCQPPPPRSSDCVFSIRSGDGGCHTPKFSSLVKIVNYK